MVDLARDRQIEIDVDALSKRLGVPVVAVQANRRVGIEQLAIGACRSCERHRRAARESVSAGVSATRDRIRRVAQREFAAAGAAVSGRAAAARRRRLSGKRTAERHRDGRLAETACCPRIAGRGRVCRCRRSKRWPATIGSRACSTASSRRPNDHRPTTSDRIDAVLTHKIWGTLIFVATMACCFRRSSCWPCR